MSWKTEKWWVSPHNYDEEVTREMRFPKKIKIHDLTLRDGEQQPGVVFRKEEKIKVAEALDELGVHRIEAGLPAVSKEDFEAIKAIAKLGLKADVFALCRAMRSDVDLALSCDLSHVVLEVPSSDILIEKGFRWNRQKVLDTAVDSLTYAKDHGLYVAFFPYDTTRADWEFERKLVKMAIEQCRIDSVTVVDTFGVTSPQAIALLVTRMKQLAKLPVEVHCHNDLGLAVANSIAAAAAGAEVIHTSVNGAGDGCGNARLEEVAVALLTLYGIDLGFNYQKIYRLSKLVEEYTRVSLPPGKPIVGENCFRKESGIFVMFRDRLIEAGLPTGASTYLPSLVRPDGRLSVVLGKKSGKNSIQAKLRDMNLSATDEQIESILQKVKALSINEKRLITDEEFKDILGSVGVLKN